ncbi:MAG: TonB-dependent siderophore receptor [Leptolyngbyaceae cyanobacterium]
MEKVLLSLNLLALMSLAGGQMAQAQVLTGQFVSELEDVDETETDVNRQAVFALASGDIKELEAKAEEPEALAESLQQRIASELENPTDTAVEVAELPLSIVGLSGVEAQPATTVDEWLAQIEASLVQIIGVRLEETAAGLQIVLETAEGELTAPTTTVSGNALIAEIPNAVLALPEGDEFQQFEPAGGIALVQVTGLPDGRVQVVITGTETAPTAELSLTPVGLTLGITPGMAPADTADDEALRVVVTGEEGSRYVEPNTSTATRTDTPLRDVPQSIQVIPREVLEDQQVIRLNDALRNVSGVVSADRTGSSQRFILRGFDDPAILRDGFRLTFGGVGNAGVQELANLETIEVLKGPASILFGSVEPGGVINLVTKQPLSEPFYDLNVRLGNRTLIEPSLDFSGPLTEDGRLLYRLNALHRREDSFRDFDNDFNRSFIAPVVRWQISDRTDLTLNFEYLDSEGPSDVGLVALGDEVADIPFDRVLGGPGDFFQSETVRIGYDFEHRFSDSWQLRHAFRFNSFDIQNSEQFVALVFDEATGNLGRSLLSSSQDQDVFELQTNVVGEFNTGSIEHTLLFGVDLFRRENPRFDTFGVLSLEIINIFDPVYSDSRPDPATNPIFIDNDTQTDTLGVYIQDQISLLDNLKLLLGVRYETVDQEVTNNPTFFNPIGSETSQNENAFSPRIGLVYQPIEAVSLYGSFSRSFAPNMGTTFEGDLLEPERGEQFEIGARAELLAGRLTANLALFNTTKQNVETPDPNNFGSVVATGEQRSQGIELDVAGAVLPGWNIIANYAYTDADITEDNSDIDGNRLFGVPEHNFNLWTTYDIQDGPLTGLGFGLGLNYVSERFGDNDNSFALDSYFLINAAISYERDNWQAGLNIRNLFDVDYIEGTQNNRLSFISPGEGFTLVGSFSIEF